MNDRETLCSLRESPWERMQDACRVYAEAADEYGRDPTPSHGLALLAAEVLLESFEV